MNSNEYNDYCPFHKNNCTAIFSIVTSIANAEDALSCLLTAECAKINKILYTACTIDDLVAIDNSAQAVLVQINALECVLKAKLEVVIPLLTDCI